MSPAMSPDHIISLLVSRKSPAQSPVFTGVTGGWETWRLGVMKKNIREAFT